MKKNTCRARIHTRSPHRGHIALKPIAPRCWPSALPLLPWPSTKPGSVALATGGAGANWSPAGTPGAGDLAIINAGASTLSFAAVVNGLSLGGGTLAGMGNLTLTSGSTWTGGTQTGTGATQFNGNLGITGDNRKDITGGRAVNTAGTTTWGGNTGTNGNGIWYNYSSTGSTINNSGTWNDTNAFSTHISTGIAFNNTGTYNKNGSAITTLDGAVNNSATGTINVNAGTLNITSNFANAGIINVDAGAIFQVSATNFANTATGVIGGNGTVTTPISGLSNSGDIDPGNSIGHLTINGDLRQTPAGTLNFELTSLSSFDLLTVTDDVTLDGKIAVWNLGYTPVVGDSFKVMTFDDRAGTTFSSLSVNGFGAGVAFNVLYNPHDVTLQVAAVPESETWVMMLTRLGLVGFAVRRRNPLVDQELPVPA
ncbi:MAG: hypothetical protein ACOY4D_01865 [Pseudomonadota bacterium]